MSCVMPDTIIKVVDGDGNVLSEERHPAIKHKITVYRCESCELVMEGIVIHYMAAPRIHYTAVDGSELTVGHDELIGQTIKVCGLWKFIGTYEDEKENPFLDPQRGD